jgi:hypothetical protein
MIKITSLKNKNLGIDIPQMVFERRADDLIDFVFIRLTEKTIWQALEKSGVPYVDWTAYKEPGKPVLKLFVELKDGYRTDGTDVAAAVREQIIISDSDKGTESLIRDDFAEMISFKLDATLLPPGTFASYTARRQAEGADLAHLKPPHINPPEKVISLLLGRPEAEVPALG